MCGRYTVADTQAKPCPLTYLSRSKEGVKYPLKVFFGYPQTIVFKGHPYVVIYLFCLDCQPAAAMGQFDLCFGIYDQIEKHLLELTGVSDSHGQVGVKLEDNLYIIALQRISPQFKRGAYDFVNVHICPFRPGLAGKDK